MRGPTLALVVVAAGSSRRMSGGDKLWERLGGGPLILYALSRLIPHANRTVLVVRAQDIPRARQITSDIRSLDVVAGGRERHESVANGIAAIPSGFDLIAIHDAARPFADAALLADGVEALAGCEGAIPGVPVADTIKRVDASGRIEETVNREYLRAVQTPQVFRASALRDSHARSAGPATDDAVLLERCGYRVRVFPGSPANFKITTVHDLEVARLLVGCGRST